MLEFTYEAQPARVIFGVGCVSRVGEEVERLGAERVLVLSTPGQRSLAGGITAQLGARAAGVFSGAVMHVPLQVVETAAQEVRRLAADLCVAVGGGSTVGLAKALALRMDLPIVAIPTTYAGSEVTPIWGLTEGGAKRTGRDPRVLPKCVIYDPALTVGLPPSVSGPSGMNAIAHCMEALYAPDGNPIVSLMAEEGIRALAASLPHVVRAPDNLEARSRALYGAWLAGASLGAVSMGLHHKLCHTLGGLYNLPHADLHSVILPHAARYNEEAAPEAMGRVAGALGAEDAPGGLFDLAVEVGAPTALRDIGMREEDLDEAAQRAALDPYSNPAPVTRSGVRRLLENAYRGMRPGGMLGQ